MEGQVSTRINAPPEKVWAIISDLTRMGEWSPETYRVEWLDGASGPAPGARFRGYNRKGPAKWSTGCTITSFEPGRKLEFTVGDGTMRWGYQVEPADGGCTLSERYASGRPTGFLGSLYHAFAVRLLYPLLRRDRQLTAGMAQTLERIKGVAERA